MSILDYFDDIQNKTGTAYIKNVTTDLQGRPVETYAVVQSNLKYGYQVDSSRQTNINDQFQNQETGTIFVKYEDLEFVPSVDHKIDDMFIEGVDNVGGQDDFFELLYRREVKS